MVYRAYTIPDGGFYQLETILDKELVFLNDFHWNPKETWMSWAYFKDFLEGSTITVAHLKSRGSNVAFDKGVPVFWHGCDTSAVHREQWVPHVRTRG